MKAKKPTKLQWCPVYFEDFFNSERVKMLADDEIGQLFRLLAYQWREGSIPPAADVPSMVFGMTETVGDRLVKVNRVVGLWFEKYSKSDRLRNPRLEEIRNEQLLYLQKKSDQTAPAREALARKRSGASVTDIVTETVTEGKAKQSKIKETNQDSLSSPRQVADGGQGNGKSVAHKGLTDEEKALLKRGHVNKDSLIGQYGGLEPTGTILDAVLAKAKART